MIARSSSASCQASCARTTAGSVSSGVRASAAARLREAATSNQTSPVSVATTATPADVQPAAISSSASRDGAATVCRPKPNSRKTAAAVAASPGTSTPSAGSTPPLRDVVPTAGGGGTARVPSAAAPRRRTSSRCSAAAAAASASRASNAALRNCSALRAPAVRDSADLTSGEFRAWSTVRSNAVVSGACKRSFWCTCIPRWIEGQDCPTVRPGAGRRPADGGVLRPLSGQRGAPLDGSLIAQSLKCCSWTKRTRYRSR